MILSTVFKVGYPDGPIKVSVKLFLSFVVIIVALVAINSVLVLHRSFQSGLQEKRKLVRPCWTN